ncbi:MAG: CsgG/HfaB family protein [Bacteroidota bacterium]
MKKYNIIVFLLFIKLSSTAQSLLDKELSTIANDLVTQVGQKMSGQNIAIGNFVNAKDEPSDLGKYLAEEFSYTLVNQAKDFRIVDRMQFKKLLEEAQLGNRGMTDPSSVQKLGRLKGITAVIYGKLIPVGNYLRIYIKVVILESQINEVTIKGDLTLLPALRSLMGNGSETTPTLDSRKEKNNSQSSPLISTTNQHIKIDFISYEHFGDFLECKIRITSIGKNENFAIQISNTKLINQHGKYYRARTLNMNGRTSSMQVNQNLKANEPTYAVIRFSNVPTNLSSSSIIELNCKPSSTYPFVARLKNITF